ncbi:MAG TPA: hypothetical protein VK327_03825 [Candidatus Paceibacterota bacterium]|nr:hypothetical protein [Candidatus Paceibacterota bacterium]
MGTAVTAGTIVSPAAMLVKTKVKVAVTGKHPGDKVAFGGMVKRFSTRLIGEGKFRREEFREVCYP